MEYKVYRSLAITLLAIAVLKMSIPPGRTLGSGIPLTIGADNGK